MTGQHILWQTKKGPQLIYLFFINALQLFPAFIYLISVSYKAAINLNDFKQALDQFLRPHTGFLKSVIYTYAAGNTT